MQVLVDSSAWIDYFKGGVTSETMDYLIDENIIVINDIILTEIIPFLKLKNQRKLISLLKSVETIALDINWDQIIDIQYKCIKAGYNGIGIPDLIIAQNAIQCACQVYSLDRHFVKMADVIKLKLLT